MRRIATAMVVAAGLVLTCGVVSAQPRPVDPEQVKRYDGESVVRVQIRTSADIRAALAISEDYLSCRMAPGPVELRVQRDAVDALDEVGLQPEIIVEDLQAWVEAERERLAAPAEGGWFEDYKDLAEFDEYIDDLINLRPDLASRFVIGESHQGHPIWAVRITNEAHRPDRCKPAVLLIGLQHSREWVSGMVTMYYMDQLIRQHGNDPYLTDLVDRVEFIFVPVMNPDGYEYTWTTERFWRKNLPSNPPGWWGLGGVDLNRNWGYEWGGPGSSGQPWTQTYRGAEPFSEPETRAVRDLILANPQIHAANDIHSFGEMVLQPWGFTEDLPPDHDVIDGVGVEIADRIESVYGREYAQGPIYTVIYPAAGTSVDWMYGARGILAYSYELRGGGDGLQGFALPPEEIIPTAEETFLASMYKAEFIAEEYPYIADWDGNCEHDINDLFLFLDDFAAGDPRADLNGDGEVDVADFFLFLELFSDGR